MIGSLLRRLFPRDIVLREAAAADARALAAIHATGFRVPWGADEFERLLVDRLSYAYVATNGPRGGAIGFVLLRGAVPETEILSVAVIPDSRRHGTGRRLIEHAFGRLAAAGYKTVFLEVEEGNDAARRLYDKLGFREVGRRPGYYHGADGAPAAALVLRRDIA